MEEIQAPTSETVEDTPQIDGISADPVDGETTNQAQQDIPQASIEVRGYLKFLSGIISNTGFRRLRQDKNLPQKEMSRMPI